MIYEAPGANFVSINSIKNGFKCPEVKKLMSMMMTEDDDLDQMLIKIDVKLKWNMLCLK